MQLKITRVPSEERVYTVVEGGSTKYGLRDFELKRWLLDLGVGASTIAAVLDIEPNETTALHIEKVA